MKKTNEQMELSDTYDAPQINKTSNQFANTVDLDYTVLYNQTGMMRQIPPHTPINQSRMSQVYRVSPVPSAHLAQSPVRNSVRKSILKSPGKTMNFTSTMCFNNGTSQQHLKTVLQEALKAQIGFGRTPDDVFNFCEVGVQLPSLSQIDLCTNKLNSYNIDAQTVNDNLSSLNIKSKKLLQDVQQERNEESRRSSWFCKEFSETIQMSDVSQFLPKYLEPILGMQPICIENNVFLQNFNGFVAFKIPLSLKNYKQQINTGGLLKFEVLFPNVLGRGLASYLLQKAVPQIYLRSPVILETEDYYLCDLQTPLTSSMFGGYAKVIIENVLNNDMENIVNQILAKVEPLCQLFDLLRLYPEILVFSRVLNAAPATDINVKQSSFCGFELVCKGDTLVVEDPLTNAVAQVKEWLASKLGVRE